MAEQATSENYSPWNSEWGSGESFIKPQAKPQTVVSATPWQEDWGTGISYLGNGLPQKSTNFSNRGVDNSQGGLFDRVFRNMIQQESRGRHRDSSGQLTTSPVGAQGITQVMPETARNPGYGIEPIKDDSEEEYLRFGKQYLTKMLEEFDGDYEKALAAYNAGPGSVKKAVSKGGAEWKKFLPKQSETVPYVQNIMKGIYSG